LLCQALVFYAHGQRSYMRGEVRDENGNLLQNVKIYQHSTHLLFRTGNYGTFGIPTANIPDTLTFSFQGYEDEQVVYKTDAFISVKIKVQPVIVSENWKTRLSSLTLSVGDELRKKLLAGNESYADLVENRFIETDKHPATGISMNIDKASYSNIRRFINLGLLVPPDAVRIEEMLNYFNLGYRPPPGSDVFSMAHTVCPSPWNKDNELLFINISAKKLRLDSLPPAQFVFLVDISGSMDMPNRLPMLKTAFRNLVPNFRAQDTISIVIYGGAVGVKLFPTSGAETEKIIRAFEELEPGGSTPGESGIKLAYSIAKKHYIEGGTNRVILATDGDFNVGVQTEPELEELIARHRESGIYLTCLGVGMGNYKDSKIQALARKGNGNFAYIDTYQEAEKVLMTEFSQTLYAVADDAYLQVKFEPSLVSRYRLVGFDNKMGALQDTSAAVEGGEIGSGTSLIAVFEILPRLENPDVLSDKRLAELTLNYLLPGDSVRKVMKKDLVYDPVPFKELDPEYQFATAVVMFGLLLKDSDYGKNISWGDILYLAGESAKPSDLSQSQFTELVYKARQLYNKQKKRRRKD